MQTSRHIPEEVLQDYAEDRADAATIARVRAHLATGCARCMGELAFWTRALRALQEDRDPAIPAEVLQRAFALFETRERKPALLERVLAVFVFDSRLQPALAGVREMEANSFKMLFEAAGTTVDLLCLREGDRWRIAGQVLSTEPPEYGWKVLLENGQEHTETSTDALGEFTLRDLMPGIYDIAVRDLEHEIVLPQIELQPLSYAR